MTISEKSPRANIQPAIVIHLEREEKMISYLLVSSFLFASGVEDGVMASYVNFPLAATARLHYDSVLTETASR